MTIRTELIFSRGRICYPYNVPAIRKWRIRPYDILLLATYRYRESTYSVRDIGMHDGTNIWSPPRATSAGDMLGNSASRTFTKFDRTYACTRKNHCQ